MKSKALNAMKILKLKKINIFQPPIKNDIWTIIVIRNFTTKGADCHHLNSRINASTPVQMRHLNNICHFMC